MSGRQCDKCCEPLAKGEDWVQHQQYCNICRVEVKGQVPLFGAYGPKDEQFLLQYRDVSGEVYQRLESRPSFVDNVTRATRKSNKGPTGSYSLHLGDSIVLRDNTFERDTIRTQNTLNHEAEQLAGRGVSAKLRTVMRPIGDGVTRAWPNGVRDAKYAMKNNRIKLELHAENGAVYHLDAQCCCDDKHATCAARSAEGKLLQRELRLKGIGVPVQVYDAHDDHRNPVRLIFDENRKLLDVEWDISHRSAPPQHKWQQLAWSCNANNLDQITGLSLAVADRIARLKELEGETELSPERDELQTIAGVIDAHRQRLEDNPEHEADSNVNSAVHKALEHLWEPIEGRMRVKRFKSQVGQDQVRAAQLAYDELNKLASAYQKYQNKKSIFNRIKWMAQKTKIRDLATAFGELGGETYRNEESANYFRFLNEQMNFYVTSKEWLRNPVSEPFKQALKKDYNIDVVDRAEKKGLFDRFRKKK